MKKILLATLKPFTGVAVEGIRKIFKDAGYQLFLLEKYSEQADLVDTVKDVDALIIRSDIADREVIQAGKKLKIVVRAGAGYDNIDLKAASDKGVVAMNTPGQNSNAVAELVFGLMLYMSRACFSGRSGSELRGKKLGLLALGNVGRLAAEIGKAFGMEVFAFDPFIPKTVFNKSGVTQVKTIEDLFSTCQFVSLHIPLNEQTRKSISLALLSKMPKDAMLINTARKEIIDEAGLLRMFATRPDFRYVSDIVADCKEELEEKYHGRFYFTPKKMGAQTEEANINAGLAAARQIVDFFEKGDKTYQVNK